MNGFGPFAGLSGLLLAPEGYEATRRDFAELCDGVDPRLDRLQGGGKSWNSSSHDSRFDYQCTAVNTSEAAACVLRVTRVRARSSMQSNRPACRQGRGCRNQNRRRNRCLQWIALLIQSDEHHEHDWH